MAKDINSADDLVSILKQKNKTVYENHEELIDTLNSIGIDTLLTLCTRMAYAIDALTDDELEDG